MKIVEVERSFGSLEKYRREIKESILALGKMLEKKKRQRSLPGIDDLKKSRFPAQKHNEQEAPYGACSY